jgi:peptide/nickel transport system ATP-binding protein
MTQLESTPLLRVQDLQVSFNSAGGPLVAVDGVSFHIAHGERFAVVGESGSGKSVTGLSITRLIEYQGGTISPDSQVWFDGADLTQMSNAQLRAIRGREIGMIFQDPQASLNPVRRVGHQISETLRIHGMADSKRAARARAIELLDQVGIDQPGERIDAYPHELSGGMRQRVMIAMALAPHPKLLIADEPTTALDALIQRQIVELLYELTSSMNLSLLMVSHDLRLVAGFVDRLCVMYAGSIVESGTAAEVFGAPQHQYTRALLESLPSQDHSRASALRVIGGSPPTIAARPRGCPFHPRCRYSDGAACETIKPLLTPAGPGAHEFACHHPGLESPAGARTSNGNGKHRLAVVQSGAEESESRSPYLLEVTDLAHRYPGRRGAARAYAAEDVTFSIPHGKSFGLVGESGSGKSTVARSVARLIEPTKGKVLFHGQDLLQLSRREMRATRRGIQVVFQDPRSSLDPRMRVGELLKEPMRIFNVWGEPGSDQARLVELVQLVGLSESDLHKYPHQFSGGQLQRVAIARALALNPDLVICDEPVSSLDASVSAQIINLLRELQQRLGLTYLFIGHDLSIVRYFCDEVAVMSHGRIVEMSDCESLFANPKHPYTRELLEAQPVSDLRAAVQRADFGMKATKRASVT